VFFDIACRSFDALGCSFHKKREEGQIMDWRALFLLIYIPCLAAFIILAIIAHYKWRK
jgi:hypothetical protein